MSLKATATSCVSLGPLTSARASRSPSSTRLADCASFEAGAKRIGQEPREHEPDRQREGSDRDQSEHAPAHAVVDGLDALRHANGADGLAPRS